MSKFLDEVGLAELVSKTKSFSQKKTLSGSSAPTTATIGELGQLYLETTNNVAYICTSTTGGYQWQKLWSSVDTQSWEGVRDAIRLGYGEALFPVGTTFTINVDGLGDTIWTVMHHITNGHSGSIALKDNKQYGMILQSRDVLYYGLFPFDDKEAFYSNPTLMSAGTYNFLLGQHSWVSADVGKYFKFTTSVDIPANSQFVFQQGYNQTLEGASVKVFVNGSTTTALATFTLTQGQDGTYIGELRNNFSGDFNSCQRAFFGNNRWKESFERQFLNNNTSGNWWVAQNKWDRYHSYQSNSGFMYRLPLDFKSVIGEVNIDTVLNNVCDGGTKETTTDKIFLPSRSEVYGGTESSYDGGVPWQQYINAIGTASPTTGATQGRVKVSIGTSTARYWWWRTPYVGDAGYTRLAHASGAVDCSYANGSRGTSPACVIY